MTDNNINETTNPFDQFMEIGEDSPIKLSPVATNTNNEEKEAQDENIFPDFFDDNEHNENNENGFSFEPGNDPGEYIPNNQEARVTRSKTMTSDKQTSKTNMKNDDNESEQNKNKKRKRTQKKSSDDGDTSDESDYMDMEKLQQTIGPLLCQNCGKLPRFLLQCNRISKSVHCKASYCYNCILIERISHKKINKCNRCQQDLPMKLTDYQFSLDDQRKLFQLKYSCPEVSLCKKRVPYDKLLLHHLNHVLPYSALKDDLGISHDASQISEENKIKLKDINTGINDILIEGLKEYSFLLFMLTRVIKQPECYTKELTRKFISTNHQIKLRSEKYNHMLPTELKMILDDELITKKINSILEKNSRVSPISNKPDSSPAAAAANSNPTHPSKNNVSSGSSNSSNSKTQSDKKQDIDDSLYNVPSSPPSKTEYLPKKSTKPISLIPTIRDLDSSSENDDDSDSDDDDDDIIDDDGNQTKKKKSHVKDDTTLNLTKKTTYMDIEMRKIDKSIYVSETSAVAFREIDSLCYDYKNQREKQPRIPLFI